MFTSLECYSTFDMDINHLPLVTTNATTRFFIYVLAINYSYAHPHTSTPSTIPVTMSPYTILGNIGCLFSPPSPPPSYKSSPEAIPLSSPFSQKQHDTMTTRQRCLYDILTLLLKKLPPTPGADLTHIKPVSDFLPVCCRSPPPLSKGTAMEDYLRHSKTFLI